MILATMTEYPLNPSSALEIALVLVAVLCVCFFAAGYTKGHDDGRNTRRIKPKKGI
ncbi:hypothetical protein TSACC_3665 [Terrimicrobium sacchariphilum]|uniref:Uncharacterized protein n=1 Tax=Terrimicrobium sacchariphilum TaxID=690879 RepID=A0A146GG36_TERSA|nr:hypothetical protein [Terrimicrobium sacchariphilum]GAT35594.1 hypothetical protein TSACC_3665 [Terrimicrobium sacchariphilum]